MGGVKAFLGFVLGARVPELLTDIGLHVRKSDWMHRMSL
jgi:hypothetical protein